MRWLPVFLLSAPVAASAQTVEITFDPSTRELVSNQLGIQESDLEDLVRSQLGALYGLSDADEFLRLSANSQSFANKGLGAHYGSSFEGLIFGIGANVAASANESDLENLAKAGTIEVVPERAVPVSSSVQLSLMAGYEFSKLGLEGLAIYVNGLYYPLKAYQLDGTFLNVGGHVQYTLFGPAGTPAAFEWGGVRVTTGLQMSRARYELSDVFETSTPIVDSFELKSKSTGTLVLDQKAFTVPLEVTASITFAYFVTLFAGAGIDLPLGKASMSLALDSELEAQLENDELPLGTARLTIEREATADDFMPHVIAGLEVNAGPVHAFGQANVAFQDATVGVTAGARFTF